MAALNFVTVSGTIGSGLAGYVQFSIYNWLAFAPNIPAPQPVTSTLVTGDFTVTLLATDNSIPGVYAGWSWQMRATVEGVNYEPVIFSLPFSAGANQAWANIASASVPLIGQTISGYLAPDSVNLGFATSVAVNAAVGNVFNLTLTASTATLANPSNPVDGQVIRVRVTQGPVGSFTLNFGNAYDFGSTGKPALSTTTGSVDILGFEYVASISKWCFLGAALGN